jgi:hypothetical protein
VSIGNCQKFHSELSREIFTIQGHIPGLTKGIRFEHLVARRIDFELKVRKEVEHAATCVTSRRILVVFVLSQHLASCHQHFTFTVGNETVVTFIQSLELVSFLGAEILTFVGPCVVLYFYDFHCCIVHVVSIISSIFQPMHTLYTL